MSHGHKTPKHYGGKAPLGTLRIAPTTELVSLAAMREGSAEHAEWLCKQAASLEANLLAMWPTMPQPGWTYDAWAERARKAAEAFLTEHRKM